VFPFPDYNDMFAWLSVKSLYSGTNWHKAMNWCGTTGTLFLADFNNDGKEDLLCHEQSTGKKWISYNRYPSKGGYDNSKLNFCWLGDTWVLQSKQYCL